MSAFLSRCTVYNELRPDQVVDICGFHRPSHDILTLELKHSLCVPHGYLLIEKEWKPSWRPIDQCRQPRGSRPLVLAIMAALRYLG